MKDEVDAPNGFLNVGRVAEIAPYNRYSRFAFKACECSSILPGRQEKEDDIVLLLTPQKLFEGFASHRSRRAGK